MNDTQTPRTDAEAAKHRVYDHAVNDYINMQIVLADFARTLERELAALQAKVAEGEADRERLDWMQSERASVEVNEEEPLRCHVESSNDYEQAGTVALYNIREAIDSARSAARTQEATE